MKVHELAKENGFTATKFMEEIRKFGIDKKHHMNVLSDEEVSLIRKKLQKGVQNNQNNGKTENLNKSENKTTESTKENIVKMVSSHSDSQKNNNAEHSKISEHKNINKNYEKPKQPLEKDIKLNVEKKSDNSNINKSNLNNTKNLDNNKNQKFEKPNRFDKKENNKKMEMKVNLSSQNNKANELNREKQSFQNRDSRDSKDNRENGGRNFQNRDNRNREDRKEGFRKEGRDNFRRDNRNFNKDGNNQTRDNRDNRGFQNRDRDNQSGSRNFQSRDNRNREDRKEGFRKEGRDNFRRDNRNFNKDGNNQARDSRDNRGFQNRDRDNQSGGRNFRDRQDNRGFSDRGGFNKDRDDFRKDSRNFSNAKKETSSEIPAATVAEKGKAGGKGKGKFDKKKYEKNRRDREQQEKELRSDFRKDDKKKKKNKKQEKVVKDEIVRIEGESIGMITIGEEIVIKDLAEKLGINVSDIIKKFFMEGKLLTANAILSFEEAEEVALEYEVIVEKEVIEEISYGEKYQLEQEDTADELVTRAPVITIMGHVDHGKTSLLDALRHTNVMSDEAGGITQKIGAYQVNWKGQRITFIDTPGHEAFTEMRARGANITDISILIVAADDGVKPQTVEAISHAKEAGVPIIVAINKIDKPGADPMKVRTELTEYGLMSPEWGGTTEFVEISAKQKINLEELLETILITAELQELKANPNKRPKAVVVESRLDPKMGAVADVLVQEGTLKIGDVFVAGESHGRVRSMLDDRGKKISKAIVSQPVEIIGFNVVPNAGDILYGVESDKQAKKIVEDFIRERKVNEQNKKKHISLESLSQELEEQELKELKCIIRADSRGSVEALRESLEKLNTEKVVINVIQGSAGAVTEGDVKLAEASNAIIIAFNVRPTTPARIIAEKTGVEIRNYNVIYHATEEIEKAMKGMLDPEYKEVYYGRIEVKQVFKVSNVGNVAGASVVDGKVTKDSKIRVIRDGIIIFNGELGSLKRFKDDVKEVVTGQECGIGIQDFNDIKAGDIIESYIMEEIPR
ncbi:translation initiation factor IF-2 [Leptotrichia trevisanii]|uniref:Translation initiation factor IF-2 n=1 Tax=Leptotrichia trevisanii TaxID=109328 RepID=A0A510KQL3_9FUSO|nr:translation initiation factor IF-2 [Leptotrichia trevisanii]BBM52273.1 translation initiation factor IF-2 [Leptotrichia trevisanii]